MPKVPKDEYEVDVENDVEIMNQLTAFEQERFGTQDSDSDWVYIE